MKTLKVWIGYILAAVFICLLFLYLRFPAEELKHYIQSALFRLNPEAELNIGLAKAELPLGLGFRDISYANRERRGETFLIQRLSLGPDWGSLLAGRPLLRLSGDLYGGKIGGYIEAGLLFATLRKYRLQVELNRVDIGRSLYLQGQIGRPLTGSLSGIISYQKNDPGAVGKPAEGRAELSLRKGTYQLQEKIAGLDRVEFKELEIKLDFRGNQVNMTRFNLVGEGARITLTGTLTINTEEILDSLMDLKGHLETAPGKRQAMTITGTLRRPATSII